jgi:hypothetical protein
MGGIRRHLTYANVMVTILAFLVLGGGTALAAYVVSSNSQIGPGTVSGHKPPSGKHANIISGSVNGTDLSKPVFQSAGLPNDASSGCSSIANTWASLDRYGKVGYYRDLQGRVYLRGVVEICGTPPSGNVAFTLPLGFRPLALEEFPILNVTFDASRVAVGLSIDNSGKVAPRTNGSSVERFSLSGVSFRCAPSGQNGCP